MLEPSSYEVVELAKSGRSTCKKCRQLILKDTLRVGKVYRDQDDRERKSYYHPACWPVPRKLVSIEEVRGFASLTQEQREILELRFRQPRAVGGKQGKAPAEVQAQAPPALSAEDAAEQEWLHGQAGAASASATAAAAPSAESDVATSWRARAPPGFPPDQLDFLLSQPAAECAEAVPAMAEALAALVAAGDASPTALEQREALRFSIAVAKARSAAPPAPPEAEAEAGAEGGGGTAASAERTAAGSPRAAARGKRAAAAAAPKRKRARARGRRGESEEEDEESASQTESDGEESEWEDVPVELKPAKLRARRNKVKYADEADEADEEGAEKAAPAASGAQEAEEEEGKEEEDSATEDNDDDDEGGGGATRQRGGTAGGDAAAGGRAEWRVMLGGRFQPYEPRVQKVIEAAYARRHLVDEVVFELRGTEYIICFSAQRQQMKADPSRWREVQRRLLPSR